MTREYLRGSTKGPTQTKTRAAHFGVHEAPGLGVPVFISGEPNSINLLGLNNVRLTPPEIVPVNNIVPIESIRDKVSIKYILNNPVGRALSPVPKAGPKISYIHESLFTSDWRPALYSLIGMQQPVNLQDCLIPYWGCSRHISRAKELTNSNTSVVCLFDFNLSTEQKTLHIRDLAYLAASVPGKLVIVGSVNPGLLKDFFIDALPLDTEKFTCPACDDWSRLGNGLLYEYMRELTWQRKT